MLLREFVMRLMQELNRRAGETALPYLEVEEVFYGLDTEELDLERLSPSFLTAISMVNQVERVHLQPLAYDCPNGQECFSSLALHMLRVVTMKSRPPRGRVWLKSTVWRRELSKLVYYTVEGMLKEYPQARSGATQEVLKLTGEHPDAAYWLNEAQEARLIWGELMMRPGYIGVVTRQLKLLERVDPNVVVTDLMRAVQTAEGLPKTVSAFETIAAAQRVRRLAEVVPEAFN